MPYTMAVDGSGSVTVAGSTDAANYPVTANAYQTTCNCANLTSSGFVSRVSPDGSSLVWSTFLNSGSTAPYATSYAQSIALDSSDDVYVMGSTDTSFPASSGALQTALPPTGPQNAYAVKLSSDGTKLLYSTNLGGSSGVKLSGLVLDQSGNVWITGHTNSSDFPGVSGISPIGIDFALELNADASALDQFLSLVPGTVTQPPAFDSDGNLLLLSSQGNLLRLDTSTYSSAPAVLAMTNAAVLTAQSGLAPGEIATFFGVGLGPSPGIVGMPDLNGIYPTELGGVTVQFTMNGLPPVAAPLLYVGPGQINFQVPFRFLGQGSVTVTTPTTVVPSMQISQIASPGIFQQNLSGFAAALNQDGSVNSPSNPAQTGSIVSLFVTGLSQNGNAPFEVNGAIAQSASPISLAPSLGIEVLFGNWPLPVLYAGAAPGLIDGVFQINVELPQAATNPELIVQQIQTGGTIAVSNTVQIYAQ